ncbi:MAG: phenylalanine--tRNA ligase subunit alpha [Candidatus Aenigmarchaeota archaeon]|nr:phenylalanine--tRNA ligase subunit alpha [Candidatus Aenigmarchaeota archaeon]
MTSYELTQEGKEYLKEGLPEKRLVEFLASTKEKYVEIEEASKKIKNFHIALKWAIENSWVEKKGNKIFLLKFPEKFEVQEALEKIEKKEEVSQELLKILTSRKLVRKVLKELEEVKKLKGKEVAYLTPELIKTGFWREVKFKPYSVEIVGKKIYPGKRHPYARFLNEVRKKLVELGFKEVRSIVVTTEFWNFDALFQPQNHPARDWSQSFSLKYPKYGELPEIAKKVKEVHEKYWKYKWDEKKASQLMPVAHDTALSPMILASKELEIPGKYFQIVRVYRPEVPDAKHSIEFTQMGGVVIDENLNFRDLLGLLKKFVQEIVGDYEVKFVEAYFPFTEPSCEVLVKHPVLGWSEVCGAGIFREELTEALGIKLPVLAWGFGVDRLAMVKIGIEDIRELFSRNLKWLREMPIKW